MVGGWGVGRSCRAILEFCLPQAPIGKNPNAHQRRTDELQYIHTMELPLALKRDKLLIYAITHESQKHYAERSIKNTYCMIPVV